MKIEVETWWINGKRYRSDGPAVISYFENGFINEKRWYTDEKINIIITYFENGTIKEEKRY